MLLAREVTGNSQARGAHGTTWHLLVYILLYRPLPLTVLATPASLALARPVRGRLSRCLEPSLPRLHTRLAGPSRNSGCPGRLLPAMQTHVKGRRWWNNAESGALKVWGRQRPKSTRGAQGRAHISTSYSCSRGDVNEPDEHGEEDAHFAHGESATARGHWQFAWLARFSPSSTRNTHPGHMLAPPPKGRTG